MAIPTVRLYDSDKGCTTVYCFEEDPSVDLRLRNCIRAMDRTIPGCREHFKAMSFFAKLTDANLSDETVTKVMRAINFLVKHFDRAEKNPLVLRALDRVAACINFELGESEMIASAYYGLHTELQNVAKEEVEAVFGKEIIEQLSGIESVNAEQAANLDPLAKRVKLIAYYANSDGEIQNNMTYKALGQYQERIHPIMKACILSESDRVSKAVIELFRRRDQLAQYPQDYKYSIYGSERFMDLCPWPARSGWQIGHPGISVIWNQSPSVGLILDVEGTIFKVAETVRKQGFFVEYGKMEIAFSSDNDGGLTGLTGLIVKDLLDDSQSPSIKSYNPFCKKVQTFAAYIEARKKEIS